MCERSPCNFLAIDCVEVSFLAFDVELNHFNVPKM